MMFEKFEIAIERIIGSISIALYSCIRQPAARNMIAHVAIPSQDERTFKGLLCDLHTLNKIHKYHLNLIH